MHLRPGNLVSCTSQPTTAANTDLLLVDVDRTDLLSPPSLASAHRSRTIPPRPEENEASAGGCLGAKTRLEQRREREEGRGQQQQQAARTTFMSDKRSQSHRRPPRPRKPFVESISYPSVSSDYYTVSPPIQSSLAIHDTTRLIPGSARRFLSSLHLRSVFLASHILSCLTHRLLSPSLSLVVILMHAPARVCLYHHLASYLRSSPVAVCIPTHVFSCFVSQYLVLQTLMSDRENTHDTRPPSSSLSGIWRMARNHLPTCVHPSQIFVDGWQPDRQPYGTCMHTSLSHVEAYWPWSPCLPLPSAPTPTCSHPFPFLTHAWIASAYLAAYVHSGLSGISVYIKLCARARADQALSRLHSHSFSTLLRYARRTPQPIHTLRYTVPPYHTAPSTLTAISQNDSSQLEPGTTPRLSTWPTRPACLSYPASPSPSSARQCGEAGSQIRSWGVELKLNGFHAQNPFLIVHSFERWLEAL